MIRIAMPWIIDAADNFARLNAVNENAEKITLFVEFSAAKNTLDQLYVHSIYRPYLRVSLQQANALAERLQGFLDQLKDNWDGDIETWRVSDIRAEAAAFSQIFKSELGTLPSFLVLPKGSYDVGMLTEAGETLFPGDTGVKVPETLSDMRDAAKALAFELPTACGFHTFRGA